MRLVFISSVIATKALRTISAVIGSTAAPSPPALSQGVRVPARSPPGRGFRWGRCPVVWVVMVYSTRRGGRGPQPRVSPASARARAKQRVGLAALSDYARLQLV